MSANNDDTAWKKLKHYLQRSEQKWRDHTLPNLQATSMKSFRTLASVDARPFLHRCFVLSTLGILALGIPLLISSLLVKDVRPPNGQTSIASLIDFPLDDKNVLGSFLDQTRQLTQSDPFQTDHQQSEGGDLNAICEDSTRPTHLPLTLDSTIVMQDGAKSLAAIQVRGKNKIQAFRIAEKIESMARIDKIERLRTIIRNMQTNQCEYIANTSFDPKIQAVRLMDPVAGKQFLDAQQNIGAIKSDGNNFQINKQFLKEKLSDLGAILTQAKAIPITNPDGTMSFRIEEVEPGGVFALLGITNGDVITKINGQQINSYNEVMGTFSQIANLTGLNLTVTRNGTETPLQYNFVDQ